MPPRPPARIEQARKEDNDEVLMGGLCGGGDDGRQEVWGLEVVDSSEENRAFDRIGAMRHCRIMR